MKKILPFILMWLIAASAFAQPTPLAGVKRIVAGTNITLSPTNGVGTVTVNSSGGGTPAGSTGDFQINSLGSFGSFTPGSGIQTALQVNVGTAGAPVINGGALGTPTSGVGTNLTGTAASLTVGNATNAVNVGVTDDTATNATMYLLWATANTGNLPAKLSSTKLTFNPSTGNLVTTGTLTSGSGASTAGSIALTQGTTQSAGTTNITIQAPTSVTSYVMTLPGAVGGANTVLTDVAGNGVLSWAAAGGTGANPSASVGLAAVNGSASTFLRSDGAPALSQSIAPTWTGVHTFTPTARSSGAASYFVVTTPADTNQTLSTESIGANFTAATRQWATGALTTQRERVFAAPTYGFVGASTLTTAINVDIADPIQGTNATLTNKYGLRVNNQQITGTLTANTGTNLIGPLVDSVDGTTPLNNINQVVATGTAYTLTTSYASLDFGTTDPILTIANAGTYAVYVNVQTSLSGTTSTTQTVSFKLRRTNNTAADLTGSTFGVHLPAATAETGLGPSISIGPIKYTTALTNDTLTVQGILSASLGAGSVTASDCTITAIRMY